MKRILKIFLTTIILLSAINIQAYAGTWIPEERCNGKVSSWSYIYEDGTVAKGWQCIGGDWYYFDGNDVSGYRAEAGINCKYNSYYDGYENCLSKKIDGYWYYFDKDAKMLRNCNFIEGTTAYPLREDGTYFYCGKYNCKNWD